jgi:hypothetical protein
MGCYRGLVYRLDVPSEERSTSRMMVKTTTSKLPKSRASPLKRNIILEDIVYTLLVGSFSTTEAFSVSERDASREAPQITSVSSLVRRSETAFFCDEFFQVGMVSITNERGGGGLT